MSNGTDNMQRLSDNLLFLYTLCEFSRLWWARVFPLCLRPVHHTMVIEPYLCAGQRFVGHARSSKTVFRQITCRPTGYVRARLPLSLMDAKGHAPGCLLNVLRVFVSDGIACRSAGYPGNPIAGTQGFWWRIQASRGTNSSHRRFFSRKWSSTGCSFPKRFRRSCPGRD
jgi:hypothetical protein